MSLLRSLGSRLWSLIRPTHKHSKEAPGVGTPEAAGQWAQAATAAPQPPVRGVTPPSLATAPARVLPPKSTGSSASTSPFLGQPDPRPRPPGVQGLRARAAGPLSAPHVEPPQQSRPRPPPKPEAPRTRAAGRRGAGGSGGDPPSASIPRAPAAAARRRQSSGSFPRPLPSVLRLLYASSQSRLTENSPKTLEGSLSAKGEI